MKFKIGDKIKCIQPYHPDNHDLENKIYTISNCDWNRRCIEDELYNRIQLIYLEEFGENKSFMISRFLSPEETLWDIQLQELLNGT